MPPPRDPAHPTRPPHARSALARLAAVALCLLTACFTDLRLSLDLGPLGRPDAPVADLLALALALDHARDLALRQARPPSRHDIPTTTRAALRALPVARLWLAALAAGLLSAWLSGRGWAGIHATLRGPLFCWLVYGGGVAGTIRQLPAGWILRLAALDALWLAGLILPPAAWVIAHGYYGAVLELAGLVNNHKVPAVALAPLIAPLILWRPLIRDRWRPWIAVAAALGTAAVLASFSRTAWIAAALGLSALIRWRGRPLIARPGAALTGVAAAFAALIALPLLAGIRDMADSFDSRSSLNLRAWQMFTDSPWYGQGPGAATAWHMAPRHARIDGVEAHGIVQKYAGELGLLGIAPLLAWAALTLSFWKIAAAPAADPGAPGRAEDHTGGSPRSRGAALLGLCLQLNLLLSTDLHTSAHWAPLALALGLIRRDRRAA